MSDNYTPQQQAANRKMLYARLRDSNNEHKQGHDQLRGHCRVFDDTDMDVSKTGPEYFCCLGEACDLYKTATGKGRWKQHNDEDWHFIVNRLRDGLVLPDVASGHLPKAVMEWYGFDGDDCVLGPVNDGGQVARFRSAVAENDSGVSWSAIADMMEQHYDHKDSTTQQAGA